MDSTDWVCTMLLTRRIRFVSVGFILLLTFTFYTEQLNETQFSMKHNFKFTFTLTFYTHFLYSIFSLTFYCPILTLTFYAHPAILLSEMYCCDLRDGSTDKDAAPVIEKETVSTSLVNGKDSLGPTVGKFSMNLAIAKAKVFKKLNGCSKVCVLWTIILMILIWRTLIIHVFHLYCLLGI